MAPEQLILSHFTLAPMHPIEERVRLAAANGFAGIGLFVGQYLALEKEGFAPHGLADLLSEHDLCLAEIEVVTGLGRDGVGGERAALFEDAGFRMADFFGCRYMQVIGPAGDVESGTRAFGSLCDRAADHGLVLGLEFLPFTDIYSVDDARRIVEGAGRPNGGICVDSWHHQRGANDLAAIGRLPGELVTGVQMNDGTRAPQHDDYYTDCLANRVAPGDGEFDLTGLIETLRRIGAKVPWSVEAPSATGWENASEHVARCATGMRSVMGRTSK
ncbi:MAG: hypothetical protein B7C54_10030 [Acidimicrobiales bacterium mtb01]|nr:MAG: hypothetical protein B7C54_10030 [Acidimicrobiales bacterium mtb01]